MRTTVRTALAILLGVVVGVSWIIGCGGGASATAAGGVLPSGTVVAFAGSVAPEGWLLCDGAAISRTTYAALFSAIGIAHGGGDGVATFNVPDYRGRFLRGVDGGVGRDPEAAGRVAMNLAGATGDVVGSVQGHAFAAHNHIQQFYGGATGGTGWAPAITTQWAGGTLTDTRDPVSASGGAETRPANANVNWLIKI